MCVYVSVGRLPPSGLCMGLLQQHSSTQLLLKHIPEREGRRREERVRKMVEREGKMKIKGTAASAKEDGIQKERSCKREGEEDRGNVRNVTQT